MANIIYTNYFEQIDLFQRLKKEGRIVNTPFRNTVSENSFCFEVGMKPSNTTEYKEHLLKTIKEVFGITNRSFDEKFYQAINGAGQEWKELNVFHSSSLLALLCFYNVSKENPLSVETISFEKEPESARKRSITTPSSDFTRSMMRRSVSS